MHKAQQGVTHQHNIINQRHKAEILKVFMTHGELCYAMLVKRGKDMNMDFNNNSGIIGLVTQLIEAKDLIETKIGTCPYTGKNAQFWNAAERELNKSEPIRDSFMNVLKYMQENQLAAISVRDLEKLLLL